MGSGSTTRLLAHLLEQGIPELRANDEIDMLLPRVVNAVDNDFGGAWRTVSFPPTLGPTRASVSWLALISSSVIRRPTGLP